jgi:hypothetical protein
LRSYGARLIYFASVSINISLNGAMQRLSIPMTREDLWHTFSQIYIQTVFAVGNRESLIKPAFKEDLQVHYRHSSKSGTKVDLD